MSEPFVVIDGQGYCVGDWLQDNEETEVSTPAVILGAEATPLGVYVSVRTPLFQTDSLTLQEFETLVVTGRYEKLIKPRYYVGQTFRNRFTQKSIEIVDVPRVRNELDGEYAYYVLTFSPTFGFNHDVSKESEINHFYISEGVVEV